MKHKLIDSQELSKNIQKVLVELIPENKTEKIALINIGKNEANEQQTELINSYLISDLNNFGSYSLLSIEVRDFSLFTIEILHT